MSMNERVADAAMALIGVPFRLRGRSAETGLDCVGLAVLALRQAGWPVPDPPPYQLRGFDAARAAGLLGAAGLLPAERALAGDMGSPTAAHSSSTSWSGPPPASSTLMPGSAGSC